MEIILLQDIENLGTRGKIVSVADGYARNYLLPKKLAIAATPRNRKWVEQQRAKFLKLDAREKAEAEELAQLMQGVAVVVRRKAGEKGTLFGSVTAMDIAQQLATQGFNIDKRRIRLDAPLKVLGEYDVPVKLHHQVSTTVKVKVESEGEAAPSPPPVQ